MPHLILELSHHIQESHYSALMLEIHQLLAQMLPTKLESCMSRIVQHRDTVIGNNHPMNAFIHLEIRLLKGRSQILLDGIAQKILERLQTFFAPALGEHHFQISVAISELPDVYHKYTQIGLSNH